MILIPGEKEGNKTACMMILAKVVDDPQSGTCLNVSYADVSGPVANYNPTGSPYAHQQTGSAFNASTASLNSSLSSVGQSLMLNGGLSLSVNLSSSVQNVNPSLTAQLLDHIKVRWRLGDVQVKIMMGVAIGVEFVRNRSHCSKSSKSASCRISAIPFQTVYFQYLNSINLFRPELRRHIRNFFIMF